MITKNGETHMIGVSRPQLLMERSTSLPWLLVISMKLLGKNSGGKTGEIIILSYMSVILVGVQYVLSFLPNIELVSLLVIIFTLVYRRKVLYTIYVFTFLQGLIYGFSIWWVTYLYVWTILAGKTYLFRNIETSFGWAHISGFYGQAYGALCENPWLVTVGFRVAFTAWVAGIPFDLVHGISNFLIALVLFNPLYKLLIKLENMRTSNELS